MSSVALTASAIEDLRRVGPVMAPRVLELVATLADSPSAGTPLLDEATGFRVLSSETGRWRVVYSVTTGGPGDDVTSSSRDDVTSSSRDDVTSSSRDDVTVHELWVDGARLDGEAYAEALDRVQGADQPDVVQLARILRRLGRITGTVPVPRGRLRTPVPDWLADALVTQAAVDPLTVAALDAASAFDLWNASRPNSPAQSRATGS